MFPWKPESFVPSYLSCCTLWVITTTRVNGQVIIYLSLWGKFVPLHLAHTNYLRAMCNHNVAPRDQLYLKGECFGQGQSRGCCNAQRQKYNQQKSCRMENCKQGRSDLNLDFVQFTQAQQNFNFFKYPDSKALWFLLVLSVLWFCKFFFFP